MTTENSEKNSETLRRRTVVRGAAWTVPVIAVAAAAPLAAASAPNPCVPVSFIIKPENSQAPADQTVVLSSSDSAGNVYSVTISSVATSTTAIGQSNPSVPYTAFNMNTSGNGWNGTSRTDGSRDYIYTGFAPSAGAGAIVLNQRAAVSPEPTGTEPLGLDEQTLTFMFTKNGVVFDPVSLSLDIFDITSVSRAGSAAPGTGAWREGYWDAVGFSTKPATIVYTGTVATYSGAGAGTFADPYRRAGENQLTLGGGNVVSDSFTFASFPSGTTMKYLNYGNERGWHFISISGLSFQVEDCDPAA